MNSIRNHKDLKVYASSMRLAKEIYKLTVDFPTEEKYGLISQLRRAAVSVPSNIAEGSARKNTKELIQFLYHSLGSAVEIETQLELSLSLELVTSNELYKSVISLNREVIYMLTGLIKSLKNK